MKKLIRIFIITSFFACQPPQDELIEEYRSTSHSIAYINDYRVRINKEIINHHPIDSLRLQHFNDSIDAVQSHMQHKLDSLYAIIHQ
jgi:hypothetical protein